MREYSIDRIFNQICMDVIQNSTRNQICPSLLAKNLFFNWKNEILHRKITIIANAKKLENSLFKNSHSESSPHMPDILTIQNNQTVSNSASLVHSKFSPIEDIYLLLISVSLINFFVSLVVPLIFIKASSGKQKNSRNLNNFKIINIEEKIALLNESLQKCEEVNIIRMQNEEKEEEEEEEKENQQKADFSNDESGGFIVDFNQYQSGEKTTRNASSLRSSKKTNENLLILKYSKQKELALLHLMMPLVFFQGFIRTILFNELNKVAFKITTLFFELFILN